MRTYNTAWTYWTSWNWFRPFGPVLGGRLDHHLLPPRKQARKILYCSLDALTSLAEVFHQTGAIDPYRLAPRLVVFTLASALVLLDLTDEAWLTKTGAPSDLNRCAHPTAQEWSRAVYEAYPEIDGILYASARHPGGRNVALYEKAILALPATPDLDYPLSHPDLRTPLENAAIEIGYELVPRKGTSFS